MAKKKKDVQSQVKRMIEEARNHYEANLRPDQTKATQYYNGDISRDMPEKKGRSKVVSTDVADVTLKQLDDLTDVFFGPEGAAEYLPHGPEDVEGAAQATDYVQKIVLEQDNQAVLLFYGVFKDAGIRKMGIVKYWWDESKRVESTTFSGITFEQLQLLSSDPSVKDYEVLGAMQTEFGLLLDCRVERVKDYGCVKIAGVPNEEVWWTPESRSPEEAPCVVHSCLLPADKVLQLGVSQKLIDRAREHTRQDDELNLARNNNRDQGRGEERDDSQKLIRVSDAYVLTDGDGDDIAERRLFRCVGEQFEVANDDGEIVDEVPLCFFQMDPEPHTMVGKSNYDHQKGIQLVKSGVQRGMLDSLALSINQKPVVQRGKVDMASLLSDSLGDPIVVNGDVNSVMREWKHSFNGPDTLPVLQYFDGVSADRSGRMRDSGVIGLNADALQSTTKSAADAQVTAAQKRTKMIARLLAETGMKPLFRGILKLITKHQNRARTVRLRGKWVEVDPRAWNAGMDVQVNVGLGSGGLAEKLERLNIIRQVQELYLQNGVPFVNFTHLRNTVDKLTQLVGEKDTSRYWAPWGQQEQAQMEQAKAQQPPPPDPQMALVQIEADRAQHDKQLAEQKHQLEQWKAIQEDDRERDKQASDVVLAELELQSKLGIQANQAAINAEVEHRRAELDADVAHTQSLLTAHVDHKANEMNAEVQDRANRLASAAEVANAPQGPVE